MLPSAVRSMPPPAEKLPVAPALIGWLIVIAPPASIETSPPIASAPEAEVSSTPSI
ncbi:hypothetical protein D3C83_259150 [compost metagenome]